MPTRYPNEQMHRIKYTKLTPEQILGKLSAVSAPASTSPLSDVLAGKSWRIVLDNGPVLNYRFADELAANASLQSLSGVRRGVLRTDAGLVRYGRLKEPRVGRVWARATCSRRDQRRP